MADIDDTTPVGPDDDPSIDLPSDDDVEAGSTRKQIRREQRQVLFKSVGFVVGGLILLFWLIAALWPSLLTTVDPAISSSSIFPDTKPGGDAWFGTDQIARDVYSRVIYGARPILIVAPLATVIAIVVGTFLGLVMGYYRSWTDEILSRIIEAILSIPVILMAILVIFTFGSSRPVIIGTIAVLFVPAITRTVRSAAITESGLDYVTSAKMRGERGMFIIGREILPNVTGVIIVEATVRLGYAVFTYATLAFLGFSAGSATTPDWGVDVANTYTRIISDVWWPTIFPALAIASLVIAVNLIADSVDKALKS